MFSSRQIWFHEFHNWINCFHEWIAFISSCAFPWLKISCNKPLRTSIWKEQWRHLTIIYLPRRISCNYVAGWIVLEKLGQTGAEVKDAIKAEYLSCASAMVNWWHFCLVFVRILYRGWGPSNLHFAAAPEGLKLFVRMLRECKRVGKRTLRHRAAVGFLWSLCAFASIWQFGQSLKATTKYAKRVTMGSVSFNDS